MNKILTWVEPKFFLYLSDNHYTNKISGVFLSKNNRNHVHPYYSLEFKNQAAGK